MTKHHLQLWLAAAGKAVLAETDPGRREALARLWVALAQRLVTTR